jgi:hypothetical protein
MVVTETKSELRTARMEMHLDNIVDIHMLSELHFSE